MFRNKARAEWAAPAVAAVAFAAALAVLAAALVVCGEKAAEWSENDLRSRAGMAAAALAEPLRTLDYKAIDEAAARFKAEGLRLRICAGPRFFVSEDGTGRGFYDTLGEPDPPDVPCQWGTASAGDFTVGAGRPAGRLFAPFLRALSVVALAGIVGAVALVVLCVTLYRQRARIGELARLEKFRRDFVADVSHEIRTPLTGILGAVDLMKDSPGAERMGVLAGIAEKESKRLAELVQQILDLARLEREGDVLDLAEADVAGIAREEAERLGARYAGADGPVVVVCDARLVSRAIANLVENAFRHSGSDDVEVRCRATAGGGASVEVEDRGCGVPLGEEERIFERFHRVDPARAAETGGAGLGLAIVRRIARLHGGDAAYARAKPAGSVFSLRIGAGR